MGEERAVDSHAYAHYLHHKYFEVNYGDGADPARSVVRHLARRQQEGEARMQARYEKKKARMNAKAGNTHDANRPGA